MAQQDDQAGGAGGWGMTDRPERKDLANGLNAPIQFLTDYIDAQDDPEAAKRFADEFIEPIKAAQQHLRRVVPIRRPHQGHTEDYQ